MTLQALWQRIQAWGAPVAASDATIAPLAPPALAQEQFQDGARAQTTARQVRTETLYERVVKTNNAYVTRNQGFGDVVVSEDRSVAPLSTAERAEMDALKMGVAFQPPRAEIAGVWDRILSDADSAYCDGYIAVTHDEYAELRQDIRAVTMLARSRPMVYQGTDLASEVFIRDFPYTGKRPGAQPYYRAVSEGPIGGIPLFVVPEDYFPAGK